MLPATNHKDIIEKDNLYIHKYAPKLLSEFKGNPGVRQTIECIFDSNPICFPNLILNGPHGCGKSLLAKLAIERYLSLQYMEEGCLVINGSLNRGKDIVSEQQSNKAKNNDTPSIINFMKRTTRLPRNIHKIILIHEFHQMSPQGQMALRRIMEIHSDRLRFILVTEDLTGIIQAIQSRCTILTLQKMDNQSIDDTLNNIIKGEKLNHNQELLEYIKIHADGDIRMAVNLLQVLNKTIKNDWNQILGIPENTVIKQIIENCINKRLRIVAKNVRQLLDQGFEITDILDLFTRILINYPDFKDKKNFLRILSQDTVTIEECYTDTQLLNLFNHLCNVDKM